MHRTLMATSLTLALLGAGAVQADGPPTLEERMAQLEALVQHLQDQVAAQGKVIEQQAKTIQNQEAELAATPERLNRLEEQVAEQQAAPADTGGGWFQSVELSGLVEVEAYHTDDPYDPDPDLQEDDITLATVELGIMAQVNDWTRAEIVLLHEEDETDLEVDVGIITLADPDGPWFVTAGQFYVPFGAFESHMISDPLTLEIGETRESAVQAGFERGLFGGSLYVFNGDNKKDDGRDDRIDNWGANLGLAHEADGMTVAAGVGYINDIGDSDSLQDQVNNNLGSNDVRDHVGGWTANAHVGIGPFALIGEYLAATDRFEAGELPFATRGAKPRAWNAEAGYGFDLFGKDSTLALAYQGTKEALDLGLPKRRWLLGWSIGILENTALSFEWAHDKDYSNSDGGTGGNADTFTTQLAVEFP